MFGLESFCGLGDAFFNEELKRVTASRETDNGGRQKDKTGQGTIARLDLQKYQSVLKSQQNKT